MKKLLLSIYIIFIFIGISAQEKERVLLFASNIEYAPFGFSYFNGTDKSGWFVSQKFSEDFFTRTVVSKGDYLKQGYVYDLNELITTGGYYKFISTSSALYIGGGFLHGPYFVPNKFNPVLPIKEWDRNGYSPLIPTLTIGGYFKAGLTRITVGFEYFFTKEYNYNIIPLDAKSPVRIGSLTIGIGKAI